MDSAPVQSSDAYFIAYLNSNTCARGIIGSCSRVQAKKYSPTGGTRVLVTPFSDLELAIQRFQQVQGTLAADFDTVEMFRIPLFLEQDYDSLLRVAKTSRPVKTFTLKWAGV